VKSFLADVIRVIEKAIDRALFLYDVVGAWLLVQVQRVRAYYRTHPKARKWTIIAGPPLGLFFILMLVVIIETPSKRQLRKVKNFVASEIYSADSVLLGRYFIEDRTEVPYEEISPAVVDALIATEDIRFYSHEGIDFKSLGRVLVKSILLQDESAGGGSTLTQQLAKNLYPRKDYWVASLLINKLREIITASRLEDIYSKKELINLYLNTVPFSDNAFGIQAAAQRFFSVDAKDLAPEQAAVLIGSLKATHSYNPRLFPKRSQDRRNVVLSLMVRHHKLDSLLADSLKKIPIELHYTRITHHEGLAPYFREFLKAEMIAWCENTLKEDGTPYNLYTDGLKIYTTIDSRMQQHAEQAVARQMKEIQEEFFRHWGKDKPWKGKEEVLDDAIRRSSRYQRLAEEGLSDEEIMKRLQEPVPMKVFSWEGAREEAISPIDSIIHHLQYLNAGFLVMDPANGQVKAWVGGIDHDFYQFDHVKYSTKRQVGSIFKPIVYAMAIEQGAQPCDLISAGQETYIDKEGEKWTPKNMQLDYEVEYTMRGALAYSVNTVAVKMIQLAGVENTIALARNMGITSEIPDVPSISLGSSSVSLLEMATAYGCIANNGVTNYPYYLSKVIDLDGKVFDNFKPSQSGQRALSPETATLVRQLLQTVVYEGTASRIRWKYGVYSDIAGKTGTTQANADGWFMGFTPNLVMGSWVGADDPRIRFRNTKLGQGSNTALPIAGYFMKALSEDEVFKDLVAERFKPLSAEQMGKLDCDLYELNPDLELKILHIIQERDSIRLADTTAILPDNFLEMLYKRKQRILEQRLRRDSINAVNEALLGEIDGG
jgi:penicillin-binding protein 1A